MYITCSDFTLSVCCSISKQSQKIFHQLFLFLLFSPQRLPKQIEERNEKLKAEMLGKFAPLTFPWPW